jgi:hypothetical protein
MFEREALMQEFAKMFEDGERFIKTSSIIQTFENKGMWNKKLPMLSIPFLDWFNSYDFKEYIFIEFGSGNSTNYFADRTKHVYSFETDEVYFRNMSLFAKKNVDVIFKKSFDLENGNFDLEIKDKTIAMIDSDCNRFMLTKALLEITLPDVIIFDNSEWFVNSSKHIISKGYQEFIFWGTRPESFMDKATSVFIKQNAKNLKRNYDYIPSNATKILADPYPEDNLKQ